VKRVTLARGVVLLLLATSLLGCGNVVDVEPGAGATGLTVDRAGHLSVVSVVCRDSIDTVEIVRDREGLDDTEDNPVVATYRSKDARTGRVTLRLDRPEAGWTPSTPTRLEPDTGYIIGASGSGEDGNETAPLYVSGRALNTVAPGGIYTGYEEDGSLTRQTSAEFERQAERACTDD
jgi:hypothetical protein